MKLCRYVFTLLIFIACKNDIKEEVIPNSKAKQLELKYAEGFSVTEYEHYKVLTVTKPWPNSKNKYTYAISIKDSEVDFKNEAFDDIIKNKIERIVVTSTTNIPALELLGVENSV